MTWLISWPKKHLASKVNGVKVKHKNIKTLVRFNFLIHSIVTVLSLYFSGKKYMIELSTNCTKAKEVLKCLVILLTLVLQV